MTVYEFIIFSTIEKNYQGLVHDARGGNKKAIDKG